MLRFTFFKKEKEKHFFVLDLGTEAAKVLFCKKSEGKIIILGSFLQYFDQFSVFDSYGDFEKDVLSQAISEGIQEIEGQIKLKREGIFLTLPANILKGRVVFQNFKRRGFKKVIDQKEEKIILQKILEETKKEIAHSYSQLIGILPQDIHFVDLKILEMKIDGYRVEVLRGYKGSNLDFRILVIFLSKYYLREVEEIFTKNDFKNLKIVYPASGLLSYFKEKQEGIFLDIGGKITQFFLVKGGQLEKIDEFEGGGEAFTQALSERLGLSREMTRIIKEDYSQKKLSKETSKIIKEILFDPLDFWFKNFNSKLKEEEKLGSFLPSNFYLFGGGSQLPEIKEILINGQWEGMTLFAKPQVEFFSEIDLKIIDQTRKISTNPQYLPALLICSELAKEKIAFF